MSSFANASGKTVNDLELNKKYMLIKDKDGNAISLSLGSLVSKDLTGTPDSILTFEVENSPLGDGIQFKTHNIITVKQEVGKDLPIIPIVEEQTASTSTSASVPVSSPTVGGSAGSRSKKTKKHNRKAMKSRKHR